MDDDTAGYLEGSVLDLFSDWNLLTEPETRGGPFGTLRRVLSLRVPEILTLFVPEILAA